MTEEARATVSFGTLKRGDRIQVDIHDPQVRGLIKAGYLKINWKEREDARTTDHPDDPGRPGNLPGLRVAAGAVQTEAKVDGPRQPEPGQSDHHSAPANRSTRKTDKQPDHPGGETASTTR